MKKAKYSSRFCIKGNQKCPTCMAVLLAQPVFVSPPWPGVTGGTFGGEVLQEDALATPTSFPLPMLDTLKPQFFPHLTASGHKEIPLGAGTQQQEGKSSLLSHETIEKRHLQAQLPLR